MATNREILDNMLSTIENIATRKSAKNAIWQFLKWVDGFYNGDLPDLEVASLWHKEIGVGASTWYSYWGWVQKYYRYIESPTLYKVKPVRNRAFLKDPLTEEQSRKVLALAEQKALSGEYGNIRDNCIIQLLFFTGMRVGEIVKMDIDDIRVVPYPNQKFAFEIRAQLKGRQTKDHIMIVTNGAYHTFKGYLQLRKGKPDEAVFIEVYRFKYGLGGKRLTVETVSRMVKSYFKEAGIDGKRITAHSIRHTFATNILRNGAPLGVVQRSLGHSSVKTTERYSHMIPELKGENFVNYEPKGAKHGTVAIDSDSV